MEISSDAHRNACFCCRSCGGPSYLQSLACKRRKNCVQLTDPTFTRSIEANGFVPSAQVTVPQLWITRIGVGFSFGFKSAVGVTMAFVLLQCLWLSVVRQPLNVQGMYLYWISALLLRKTLNRNQHNLSD